MAYCRRAQSFYNKIMGEYDLRPDEEYLLEEICDVMTLIEDEKARIAKRATEGKDPTRYEMENLLRNRGLVSRLMRQLNLKDESGGKATKHAPSHNARKAAMARWGQRNG